MTAPSSPVVHFYFDFISPNAYIAWTQLPELARRHGVAIEPVPVLYAALLDAHDQLGPAEIAPKSVWMFKNVVRKAKLLGIPLSPPAFHPFNPLLALRVSSLPYEGSKRSGLIDALFRAVWVRGLHVAEPSVVEGVVRDLGLDGAAVLSESQAPEVKARLRRETDEAIQRGVFGVPSMEIGGEIFWGYDDFPFLERFLEGKDPLDRDDWRKWASRPGASAVRPRSRRGTAGS